MRRGDWERRFGAARRRTDRRLLEEVERQIALEEAVDGLAEASREAVEARERVARAFGRPLD